MTTRKPAAPSFTLHFPQLDRDIASHAGETIYHCSPPPSGPAHRQPVQGKQYTNPPAAAACASSAPAAAAALAAPARCMLSTAKFKTPARKRGRHQKKLAGCA